MSNELAVIAIKGGRYLEAEKMYNEDLKQSPTHNSYFGLGLCKLNLLLDVGRNVDEMVYCFEKAIELAEDKVGDELKNEVINATVNTLYQFKEVFTKLEEQKKKEANAAAIGAALTIGAAMIGSSKNSNAFTQIASLAAAGAGVGISLEGLSRLGKIPEIQSYIVKTAVEMTSKSTALLGDYSTEFKKKLSELELDKFEELNNNISASASSDNPWFLNNIYLILGWVLFWPVGAYGSYKRYQHNKELTN